MLLWRKFETNLQHYTYNKKVRGFYIYNGQEAVYLQVRYMDLTKDRMITVTGITFNLSEWV
jgi:TPP-dependent pyruvate/acetoin dehydrogenase alpha subunit